MREGVPVTLECLVNTENFFKANTTMDQEQCHMLCIQEPKGYRKIIVALKTKAERLSVHIPFRPTIEDNANISHASG